MKRVKDKRIFEDGVQYRAEVEFEDGTLIDLGKFKKLSWAQQELALYADDVRVVREVPKSVFIRHPQ